MEVRLALKAAGFIALDVVGIPGNLAVFLLFCHLLVAQGHMAHNELILSQLVLANLMVTLCQGIAQVLTALDIAIIFNDQTCKVILFIYRVGRAMSITTTSLLSSYQCVVIAPPNPGWTWLKRWLPGHLPHAIIFLYGLNMVIYSTHVLFAQGPSTNGTVPEFTISVKFCFVVFPGRVAYRVAGMVYTFRDFTFVGLMAAAAVYVMLVLHRHRQQVQGLQGAGRKTEEASRAVLLLVSTYVVLFGLDNALWFSSTFITHEHPAVTDTRVFVASCYSSISPVLIIATNRKLATYFQCSSKRKTAENIPNSTETKASPVTITQ
ncbi:olfactory receptor class A-like protein 1 [Anguilla anguilla]|uniref:olfactory receptor class A-like protein 1 n=1 Tax=Anguilla anguilla TaxID=7936 RepID=UPI0015ACA2CB|nr:olfactory receptor class A-like protein 1 [Anguilla anguilla]